MRYISLDTFAPAPDWVAKATKLLDALKSAADADARKTIIKRNSAVWTELKDDLLLLSHGKCWFSEARDCFSYWQVEHFRPKSTALDLDGTEHEGYWWLAFDWRNYRICGAVGNVRKSTHFPLRDAARRARGPDAEIRDEDPILLDPSDPHDPTLLSFDLQGDAIVAADVRSAWEAERVEYSVGRLNLNYPALVDRRKVVWQECWRKIETYREELARDQRDGGANAFARQGIKNSITAIRRMLQSDVEFSATARACVLHSGDPRVTRLLQGI